MLLMAGLLETREVLRNSNYEKSVKNIRISTYSMDPGSGPMRGHLRSIRLHHSHASHRLAIYIDGRAGRLGWKEENSLGQKRPVTVG